MASTNTWVYVKADDKITGQVQATTGVGVLTIGKFGAEVLVGCMDVDAARHLQAAATELVVEMEQRQARIDRTLHAGV